MIEFCIDETRLASLDQNLRSQNALSFSILRMHGGGPSCVYHCIGLADRQCHSPLGLQRYPPRAFNNQPAGVKHRPVRLGEPAVLVHSSNPPGTGLTEASAGVLLRSVCRPSSTSLRLLSITSRRSSCCRYPRAAVPANRRNYRTNSYSPGRWNRPSCNRCSLYSTTRRFPRASSTLFFHSLTDRGPLSATHRQDHIPTLIPTHDRPVMAPSFTSRPHSSGSRPTSRDQEDLVIPNRTSSLHSRIAQPTGQVAQPKVNQRAPKTLTHAYMVCGVGREPSQWARAPTPPQGKIGHMKGAVGQFWLPEILGSSPRLEQDNEIARSLHAAMRVCSALRIHRYPILLTIIGMLPS
jgi:hypothetical protein